MPAFRETYDNPEAAHIIHANECADRGAIVSMDGTMLHIDWPDTRPLEEQQAALIAQLADLRWTASQTCVWRDASVPCDTQAATNVLGAIVGLQLAGSQGPIVWKIGDGAFQNASLADLIDLGQTMRAHVQACFVNEATLTAQIAAAADAATLDAIDIAASWPQ